MDEISSRILQTVFVSPLISLEGCVLGMVEIERKVIGDETKSEKGKMGSGLRKQREDVFKMERENTSQDSGEDQREKKGR